MLTYIIENLQFTPSGIVCPDAVTAKKVNLFLREAVLDRHIYLQKAIGIKVVSSTNIQDMSSRGTNISRHPHIGESYIELVHNIHDKIFLRPMTNDLIWTQLKPGLCTMNDIDFISSNHSILDMLWTNPVVATSLSSFGAKSGDMMSQCRLVVKTCYDCGYRGFADNSSVLSNDMFPCDTNYSLADYIRILPMITPSHIVNVRYYNGCTPEIFKSILQTWNNFIKSQNIKEEESEWLRNFMR